MAFEIKDAGVFPNPSVRKKELMEKGKSLVREYNVHTMNGIKDGYSRSGMVLHSAVLYMFEVIDTMVAELEELQKDLDLQRKLTKYAEGSVIDIEERFRVQHIKIGEVTALLAEERIKLNKIHEGIADIGT